MLLEPEVLEELEKTIDEIKSHSERGAAIIVEGKKDERALRELGVLGPIYRIPSGGRTPLNSLLDLSEHEETIILTDFDQTGEDLAVFCRRQLERFGVKVLNHLRNKLRRYVRKAVKDIEGIVSFLQSERGARVKGNRGLYRSSQSFE